MIAKTEENAKFKRKWYHWVAAIFVGLAIGAYILEDGPKNTSSNVSESTADSSSTQCRSHLLGRVKSIEDSKYLAICAFQMIDDTPVAVGMPAEIITIRFSADLTECNWEERKVTEDSPHFSRTIPLKVAIDKYIDTGANYLTLSCVEPDQWSPDGETLISRFGEFSPDGTGSIVSRMLGSFRPLK